MGYNTIFQGQLTSDTVLDSEFLEWFESFRKTRHFVRKPKILQLTLEQAGIPLNNVTPPFYHKLGKGGKYFTMDEHVEMLSGLMSAYTADYNNPPDDIPSLWCPWYYDNGFKLHNGKAHEYIKWLEWFIKNVFCFVPIRLSGVIKWQGEKTDDSGVLLVLDNHINIQGGL